MATHASNIQKRQKKTSPSKKTIKKPSKTNDQVNRHDQKIEKSNQTTTKHQKQNNGGNSRKNKGKLDSIYSRGTLSSWMYLSHRVFLQVVLMRPRIYVRGEMDLGSTFCIE
jgi:hypothetical protein